MRVFNAATDAGAIDVYITDPAVDITTLTSPTFSFTSSTSVQASNFVSFGAPPAGGTYRIRVTGAGNPSDLRLDIPSVLLLNQRVATVILTPTTGGTLVERVGPDRGRAAYLRADRNTSARVRLVAAVTNGAVGLGHRRRQRAVASAPTSSRRRSAAMSAFRRAARSTSRVNGASVAAPAATLAAGSDSDPDGLRQRRQRRPRA